MCPLSTEAEAAVRRGRSILLVLAASLSVVAIPIVVALVSHNSATTWIVVGTVTGLIGFLVPTVTYWQSFRSRASAEKEAARTSKAHPDQVILLTEGPMEVQLLEELSAAEREAQALLGERTNASVIRLRSRLLDLGVWSERDAYDFDVALRTRNKIAHGEQEVSRTSVSQAIETIRRLRQKVGADRSAEGLTSAELPDGEQRPIRPARRQHAIVGPAVIALIVTVIILTTVFISRIGGPSTPSNSPPPFNSPVCAAGSLTLTGSSAFASIAQDVAAEYMLYCSGAKIRVTSGDGAYGLTELRGAVASGSPSAGSIIAMYDGLPPAADTTGLSSHPIGALIFSVVAHTGLIPASNITSDELRKIFVKPGEQGIVAVGPGAGSGSREAFITKVLGLDPLQPDTQPGKASCPAPAGIGVSFTSCTENSSTALLKFVDGTPNAIGYAEVTQAQIDYPQVSVISIGNVRPTRENVLNGSYKFWVVEHLYTATRSTTLTNDFLDFLSPYLESYPRPDFIACSGALKRLEADC